MNKNTGNKFIQHARSTIERSSTKLRSKVYDQLGERERTEGVERKKESDSEAEGPCSFKQIDSQNERYEERAAIREYCGGYSREEAERLAKRDISK